MELEVSIETRVGAPGRTAGSRWEVRSKRSVSNKERTVQRTALDNEEKENEVEMMILGRETHVSSKLASTE